MARAFGICFTVFTQMEDDPTVKTTPPPPPSQYLYRTCCYFVCDYQATPQKVLALYFGKHGILLIRKCNYNFIIRNIECLHTYHL